MVTAQDRKDIESCVIFQSTLHHPEKRVYLIFSPFLYFQLADDGESFLFCREVRKRQRVEREGIALTLDAMLGCVRDLPEYRKHLKASLDRDLAQLLLLEERVALLKQMIEVVGNA